ncbi:MAG: linked oxidase domain protein, partial [Frankiales bacterium]|nr:linked oxidase domain protein [Frankiales bacterium]
LGDLRAAVGDAHVLTDDDLRSSYETDWTRRFTGRSVAVVRPASTEEVAAVVRVCGQHGAALVLQGGNTGLVGAAVPAGGEVLLSLRRLTGLGDVDLPSQQVTVGAGVTLADLQAHARAAGLDFGVDLAARDSATVGGLAATNAGGIRVLRYGSMAAQVAGVEAVLADGSVLSRLGGLAKDQTGYDLGQLLVGSEGTLGIITQLRLRLVPQLPERAVALVAVDGTASALLVLQQLKAALPDIAAAEVLYEDGLQLVMTHTGLGRPFDRPHPAYLLVEIAGRTDPTDALVEALSEVEQLLDATVARDAPGRRALWDYREKHTESISAAGVPVKLDVCLPLAELAQFVEELPAVVAAAAPSARPVLFGHLNEGNLHVNVLLSADSAEAEYDAVTKVVLERVAASAGSISSEHGVGRSKAAYLGLSRSPVEIAAMRAVKQALDPAGLLNPGVLLPVVQG